MIVDAHHHLWNPARGDYGWMPKDDPVLSRRYGVETFAEIAQTHGVGQSVLVQAAPTTAETEYLLGIADASPLIAGVVGWIDFENPADRVQLERFAAHEKFCGVRPMVQDIADDDWLARADIAWAFDAAADLGVAFDALGFPRHARRFLKVIEARPNLRVVLDHCLKPEIRDAAFDDWAEAMGAIARDTAACCKLSGLVTEAGAQCGADALRRYSDHVLDVFGPERVMWGSDWPVSRLRVEYGDWLATARALTAELTPAQRDAVFEGTARAFYRLPAAG